jgi:hypothetical protein
MQGVLHWVIGVLDGGEHSITVGVKFAPVYFDQFSISLPAPAFRRFEE